jgi:FkbM family methyltransferase
MSRKLVKENNWTVHGFEANPFCDNQIDKIRVKLETKERKVNMSKSTAAWIYNGNVKFYLDTVNKGFNYWGSSLNPNHPDVVRSEKKAINVTCVDISSLLRNYKKDEFFVIKFDIEGAEYELLDHFISQQVLELIDYFVIAFYGHLFEIPNERNKRLIAEIEQANVKTVLI